MITRIVKLHIQPDKLEDFKKIYLSSANTIRSFSGCRSVEVYQKSDTPEIVFTYSKWDTEDDLNAYRNSNFFNDVWKSVKPLFLQKAEAWSLVSLQENIDRP